MAARKLPNFSELSKRHFFAGILVFIPFGVIAWILAGVVRFLWGFHDLLPVSLKPENFLENQAWATLFNILITLGVAAVLALGVTILGWISQQYLGRKAIDLLGDLIQQIPVIRSIYSALDQLLRTLAVGDGQQFSRVVLIEYPRKGIWALAFVTGPARGRVLPPGHLNVYVPTTPNPTSGFHLIVPESEVRESGMKVEDAFKTILSLGIAQPAEDSRG